MNKNINIAVVGLGQIGNYLYNELNKKKSDIEIKKGQKVTENFIETTKNYIINNTIFVLF